MNNERNETRDNTAAIGIGAMIVFIALILVAAVAAAVIIQTAEKLQQNAQSAGDDTQEQMSTKVVLLSTVIWDDTAASETLFSTFELAAGSNPVVPSDVSYTVVCDDGAGATAFAAGNFGGAETHEGDGTGGGRSDLPGPRCDLRRPDGHLQLRSSGQHGTRPCAERRGRRSDLRRTPIRKRPECRGRRRLR